MKSPVVQALFMVLGWIVLLPFCLARAWKACPATAAGPIPLPRIVDRWSWEPLNKIYGNPEDGVSGKAALVWYWDGTNEHLVPYWPAAPADWIRAYAWSAWRNSTNQLTRG